MSDANCWYVLWIYDINPWTYGGRSETVELARKKRQKFLDGRDKRTKVPKHAIVKCAIKSEIEEAYP